MQNQLFLDKLMDVPFIIGVDILREGPAPNLPKEMLRMKNVGLVSPVMIRTNENGEEEFVITPEWQIGHLNDVVNPMTGGLFRIRTVFSYISAFRDQEFKRVLSQYYSTINVIEYVEEMVTSDMVLNLLSKATRFSFDAGLVGAHCYINRETQTKFLCKNPYFPRITEDEDIVFGKPFTKEDTDWTDMEQVVESAKQLAMSLGVPIVVSRQKEYEATKNATKETKQLYENLKMKDEYSMSKMKFTNEKKPYVVKGNKSQASDKKSEQHDVKEIYVVTNATGYDEYTPSVFQSLKDAQEWLRKTTVNNFIQGVGFDTKLYSYEHMVHDGDILDEFIKNYLSDPNGTYLDNYSSRVVYSDESENRMNIYKVTFADKGVPTIKKLSD